MSNPLHQRLTATMGVVMAMELMREMSEAAKGCRPASHDVPSVESARSFAQKAGAAVPSGQEAHRNRADGRASHHGQDDAPRSFHGMAWPFHAKGCCKITRAFGPKLGKHASCRRNAPKRPAQSCRSRRALSRLCLTRSRFRRTWSCRHRNCCATTTRPSRHGRRSMRSARRKRLQRPARLAQPCPGPPAGNSRAASAHRRLRRPPLSPSGA